MPTSTSITAVNLKPAVFNISRALLAEGYMNTPAAQRSVGEFAVHNSLSELQRQQVPTFDATGKPLNTSSITAGGLLDVLRSREITLPGKSVPRPLETLVQVRPAKAVTPDGGTATKTARSVMPARSRATQILKQFEILNQHNLDRLLAWALERGFETFKKLPEAQRKLILTGKGVHNDSLV
jgi:hypothetical protein